MAFYRNNSRLTVILVTVKSCPYWLLARSGRKECGYASAALLGWRISHISLWCWV